MKKNWLNNKSIVISGASSGMGRSITKLLINNYHCNVIGIGRNESKMLSLKEELGDNQSLFNYQLFDVSQRQNWENLYTYLIDNNISIDVLINNAGVLPPFKSFDKFSIDDFENNMQTNFFSYIYAYKILMPLLVKSSTPSIINISSSDALCPLVGTSMYSSAKGAINNFTQVVREELKGKVYISLVCPGYVKTDIFRNQTYTNNKWIDFFAMNCDKASKKIVSSIARKKKRVVIGFDAKFMDFTFRHFPKTSLGFYRRILKNSKIDLFYGVFN